METKMAREHMMVVIESETLLLFARTPISRAPTPTRGPRQPLNKGPGPPLEANSLIQKLLVNEW